MFSVQIHQHFENIPYMWIIREQNTTQYQIVLLSQNVDLLFGLKYKYLQMK